MKKYQIERNDALGKFICDQRLFDTIQLALAHADQVERGAGQPIGRTQVTEQDEISRKKKEMEQFGVRFNKIKNRYVYAPTRSDVPYEEKLFYDLDDALNYARKNHIP